MNTEGKTPLVMSWHCNGDETLTLKMPLEIEANKLDFLQCAIASMLSPDPYLESPHPETVEAIAEFVRLMCEVSKRRPEAYRDEPWKGMSVEEHHKHASDHVDRTLWFNPNGSTLAIDDDGLPHAAHAGLRLAFGVARVEK